MTLSSPLLAGEAGNFQASWYLTMIVATMLLLMVWAAALALRALPDMWRSERRGLAVLVLTVTGITLILFVCMLLTASIGLLRGSV